MSNLSRVASCVVSRPALFALAVALPLVMPPATAKAQIFYEPVQYQYGSGAKPSDTFYYGGSDPRVFDFAAEEMFRQGLSRVSGQPFSGGNVAGDFPKVNPRRTIYSDGWRFRNVADSGYKESDARNEAYQNVPRYFRKADLLLAAVPTEDGWVVPAQTQPRPDPRPRATGPASELKPGMILILPKRPAAPAKRPDVTVASAQPAGSVVIVASTAGNGK